MPKNFVALVVSVALGAAFGLCSGCNNQLVRKSPETDLYSGVPEGAAPSLDQSLGFVPKRLWRLTMSWEPYFLDADEAILIKEFQLFVNDPVEREVLEKEISSRGGDAGYLVWLEANVNPLTRWDRRIDGRVARLKDALVVTLLFQSSKPAPMKQGLAGSLGLSSLGWRGMYGPDFVEFPDALFRVKTGGCAEDDTSFFKTDLSVAFEIILKSRDQYAPQTEAKLWEQKRFETPRVLAVERSHLLKDRVIYRAGVRVRAPLAHCPLRVDDLAALEKLRFWQPMGVDW